MRDSLASPQSVSVPAARSGGEATTADALPGVRIRPLQATDGPLILELGHHLSMQSRYQRFFSPIHRLSEPLLTHLVVLDHDDREALAADVEGHIVGVARYDRSPDDPESAEVAIVVADDWQRHGLGRRLIRELSAVAQAHGIRVFTANTLLDNRQVAALLHRLWPSEHGHYADGLYSYRLPLPLAG
jgi:GNAT superfamily N-acetyltransferase